MNRFILIEFILCTCLIWGQNSAHGSAYINATLIKGLSTQMIKPNLDFGETILENNNIGVNKDPETGINIKISGEPNRSVILNYLPTLLTCERGDINFIPDVRHTYADPFYSDPVVVNSGNGLLLKNINNEGVVFLWIGGGINIKKDQPAGEYSGSFLITVSY